MPITTPGLGAAQANGFTFKRVRCSLGAAHVYHRHQCLCGHVDPKYASLFCRVCGKPKTFCVCKKWVGQNQERLCLWGYLPKGVCFAMGAGNGLAWILRHKRSITQIIWFMVKSKLGPKLAQCIVHHGSPTKVKFRMVKTFCINATSHYALIPATFS